MSVVAVTGCSGYIGSRLLRLMDESGKVSRIIGVDLNPPRVSAAKMDFHRMDVRDPSLINLFTLGEVQAVVHLAYVFDPLHDADLEYDIDVGGTRNVLAASAACVAKHLVIASSTTAFGALPDNPDWLTENDPPRRQRNFMYASNKYENELIVRIFKNENPHVKVAVIRPCIVYGPNVDNFVSHFMIRLPFLPAVGDTATQMQFVHEDDAAEVFMRVLEEGAEGYFHACGEGTVSVEEIARMAGKPLVPLPAKVVYPLVDLLWKLRAPLIEGPSGMLDFIRYRWTASDEMTREALGLGPRMHSREVVRLMLETHGGKR
ncbi:MAG: NAD-dependent epimerase/dehydratase family protein [Actinomycetota bacterium]|nr:NAD-dependent epimerase/dehydratase family protein [Actinomycetota bacterium]MDD5666441.1 NAD-dependent epimerase/dehydratase family protein [Actinomycetota bacterium]